MSRFINPDTAGKQRNRLTRCIVVCIRELMKQPEPNEKARDLAAFIALALEEIFEGVDGSVQAWEKRGYWVKADRFRMDWEWAGRSAKAMRTAVMDDDWATVAGQAAHVAQKFSNVTVSENHRLGTPWAGAYKTLRFS